MQQAAILCTLGDEGWIAIHGPRGVIFPGGKFDPVKDRDYEDTAVREFMEETGIVIDVRQRELMIHVWSGMTQGPCFVHAFFMVAKLDIVPFVTHEGELIQAQEFDFMASCYRPFYGILFPKLRRLEKESRLITG